MFSFIPVLKVIWILYIVLELNKSCIAIKKRSPNKILKRNECNKIDVVIKISNANDQKLPLCCPPATTETKLCQETTQYCGCPTTTPICTTTTESQFECTKQGTFADPSSCNDFYICHRKCKDNSSVMERVKLSCPKGTAFDKDELKCTKTAIKKCDTKLDFSNE